jgi:hypothetical protein
MKKIGIVILATNAYFVLGVRFIKRFNYYYKGERKVKFYLFSDQDPKDYVSDDIDVSYHYDKHENWQEGTNSKFKNIVSIKEVIEKDCDYIYYFDADTNVNNEFTEDWFLGDLVGGEHYGNRDWLKDGAGFDRNPISKAYVPLDSELPYTYHYGAFFGGKTNLLMEFCSALIHYQIEDKKIGYEPGVNDESYINKYFHFNPPTYTVPCDKFAFAISDKGGIGETRYPNLNIEDHKNKLLSAKNNMINITNNQVIIYDF